MTKTSVLTTVDPRTASTDTLTLSLPNFSRKPASNVIETDVLPVCCLTPHTMTLVHRPTAGKAMFTRPGP